MAHDAVKKARNSFCEQLNSKQLRGLMYDCFLLLKRECDLNDKEALLLNAWTKNYPELGAAYRLKEAFYTVYMGWRRLRPAKHWNNAVVSEARDAFGDLIRTFSNWHRGFSITSSADTTVVDAVVGFGVPDDAIGYGQPSSRLGTSERQF